VIKHPVLVMALLVIALAVPAGASAQLPSVPGVPLPELPLPDLPLPDVPLPDVPVDPSALPLPDTGLTPAGGGGAPTPAGSPGGGPSGSAGRPGAPGAPTSGTPVPTSSNSSTVDDAQAPKLTLAVARKTSAASARRRGLRVTARCDRACTVTVRVTGRATYGTVTRRLAARRVTVLRVRLNRSGRAAVARARRATRLTVTGQAVDAAGHRGSPRRHATSVKPGARARARR
jgi:hypothetical protein